MLFILPLDYEVINPIINKRKKPTTVIWIAQPTRSFSPSKPDLPTVRGWPQWGHSLAEVETFSLQAGHGIVDITKSPGTDLLTYLPQHNHPT